MDMLPFNTIQNTSQVKIVSIISTIKNVLVQYALTTTVGYAGNNFILGTI